MKNRILYLIIGLIAVGMCSCQTPESPSSDTAGPGLNSFSVMFAYGEHNDNQQAVFTTFVDPTKEEIILEIPWYYPLDTNNETTMNEMRVMANLEANCFIDPPIKGVYDLSQKYPFTLTNKNGIKTKHYFTGEIKKLSLKSILDFTIDSHGVDGVVDEERKRVTLVTGDDLEDATANILISPHASISPDPRTPRSYNEPVEFTVTAHDGTTSVYTVKKGRPGKIPAGYREGSEKRLWEVNLAMEGITPAANRNTSLAALGNRLVLNLGNEQIYFNAITGQKMGTIAGSRNIGSGSITSDKGGNMLMCAGVGAGQTFTIYTTNSVDVEPTVLLTYTNGTGANIGKRISVAGDITKDAIITVPIFPASGSVRNLLRWDIKDGVVQPPIFQRVTGTQTWDANGNSDVVYMSAKPSDGYYTIGYSTNRLYYVNGTTNAAEASYYAGDVWNTNYNLCTVDAAVFNNKRYVATFVGRFFTWGEGFKPYLFDVSNPLEFIRKYENLEMTTFSAYGDTAQSYADVILWLSPDGFKMRMFCVDINATAMAAYEFDCVDK